jgi:hypothetical protein
MGMDFHAGEKMVIRHGSVARQRRRRILSAVHFSDSAGRSLRVRPYGLGRLKLLTYLASAFEMAVSVAGRTRFLSQ